MSEVKEIKSYATRTNGGKYVVGGIELDRPFKIRRLGHFGFNFINYPEAVRFYTDLLGFDIADMRNYADRLKPAQAAELKARGVVFERYDDMPGERSPEGAVIAGGAKAA